MLFAPVVVTVVLDIPCVSCPIVSSSVTVRLRVSSSLTPADPPVLANVNVGVNFIAIV